jgi:hypothetical protein
MVVILGHAQQKNLMSQDKPEFVVVSMFSFPSAGPCWNIFLFQRRGPRYVWVDIISMGHVTKGWGFFLWVFSVFLKLG